MRAAPVHRRATSAIRPGPAIPIVIAAVFAGCDSDSPASTPAVTTTIDTVNGTVRVVNSGTAPEWDLDLVVSIGPKSFGSTESPDEFGRVTSAILGPDDDVFVADAYYDEVRVFGMDGVHRRTFGRDGEGPGEFGTLSSLAWAGDRLLTLDALLGRVGEFTAEGEWLGQRPLQGGVTGSGIRFMPVGPDEIFSPAWIPDGSGIESVMVGHSSRGETGDTLHYLELEAPAGPASAIICRSERAISFFPVPFGVDITQHPGPDGVIYSGITNTYRIAVTRGESDTLRVIERELSSEPVTDEEWAVVERDFEAFRADYPSTSCEPRRPTRPSSKPLIGRIAVAPDGTLWVEVTRAAGDRWEVFDAEGRLLGSVPLLERKGYSAPVFNPGHIVNIRQDSLELDHVDIWRIDRGGLIN